MASQSGVSDNGNGRNCLTGEDCQQSYTTKVYEKYWSNHSFIRSWLKRHKTAVSTSWMQAYGCCYNHRSDDNVFKVPPVPAQKQSTEIISQLNYNDRGNCQVEREHTTTDTKRRKSRKKKRKRLSSTQSESNSSGLEVELPNEFLEFMKQSAQHRMEREANKEKQMEQEKMDTDEQGIYVDDRMRMTAPTEQPGKRRTHEIRLLYGQNSHKIHSMETALQLSFQQKCDKLKPPHWPNIPLRLVFS